MIEGFYVNPGGIATSMSMMTAKNVVAKIYAVNIKNWKDEN